MVRPRSALPYRATSGAAPLTPRSRRSAARVLLGEGWRHCTLSLRGGEYLPLEVRGARCAQRVYEPGEGWERLCSFLGVAVPDGPYPKVNSTADFAALSEAGIG